MNDINDMATRYRGYVHSVDTGSMEAGMLARKSSIFTQLRRALDWLVIIYYTRGRPNHSRSPGHVTSILTSVFAFDRHKAYIPLIISTMFVNSRRQSS